MRVPASVGGDVAIMIIRLIRPNVGMLVIIKRLRGDGIEARGIAQFGQRQEIFQRTRHRQFGCARLSDSRLGVNGAKSCENAGQARVPARLLAQQDFLQRGPTAACLGGLKTLERSYEVFEFGKRRRGINGHAIL